MNVVVRLKADRSVSFNKTILLMKLPSDTNSKNYVSFSFFSSGQPCDCAPSGFKGILSLLIYY